MDFRNVKLTNGFWKHMEDLNSSVTIDAVWNRFEETGRIDAFKFDWHEGMENKPHFFWDSDVVKWMEGACYIMCREERPDLREKVEMLIERIEEHQEESGYFNIYFTVCEPDKRFSNRDWHELYCAGHLFEAAVAYYYATGSDRLVKIATKYADFIEKVFMIDKAAPFMTPGHEEIELALIKLYKVTGTERYLKLAEFFLKNRAKNDKDTMLFNVPEYAQDYEPVEEMTSAVGHAVRCMYLLCSMVDCAKHTDNKEMLESCKRVYNDIVNSKMYITGGLGATHHAEAFSVPYDLPNETAYAETCAAIGFMFFADRMCKYTREAKYADSVERAMYNGMCSGISLSGDAFFYENPLEINLANRKRVSVRVGIERLPITQRKKVFDCSCCPPNLNRVLSSMGGYIYDIDGAVGYVNQFADSVLSCGEAEIVQKTNYPWDGRVSITAKGLDTLYIRIPAWCKNFSLNKDYTISNGYAVVKNDGEEIVFDMDIKPVIINSRPEVVANVGKAAVMRGPIVYCAEAVDNCENLHSLVLTNTDGAIESYSDEFHGIILELNGLKLISSTELYSELPPTSENVKIKLIPYYGFANRGENSMLVWLNR